MRHGVGPGGLGDLDLPLRDQWAGDAGAEQVLPFVERVGAEHREDEVAHEGLTQIVDEDLLHAHQLGFAAGGAEFLALAEVGGEGDHLAAVGGPQPAEDDARVEPAGIGQHHFPHVRSRHAPPLPATPERL